MQKQKTVQGGPHSRRRFPPSASAAPGRRLRKAAGPGGAALLPSFAYPYGALDPNAEKALKAAGMQATMTSEEHANRLARSPECLFGMGRFERTGFMTTARLLEKLE